MALYDEYFYTNFYNGIPYEQKKTIQDNITLLQNGSNLLDGLDNVISFASIWAGPMSKTGSRLVSEGISSLDEIGKERLNEKVKIIARNENSAQLIKTLFETKYGQTPHILMLSELVERHQYEISKLAKKYDGKNISNMLNGISQESGVKFEIIDEIKDKINELKMWVEASNAEKYNEFKIQSYYNTFNFLSQVGIASGCEDLTRIANIATSGLIIHNSVNALSTALSSGGSFASIINPITGILSVGLGLFGMFKKKRKSNNTAYIQMMINQLNMIRQQLQGIQLELRENFKNVFENFKIVFECLESISEKLYNQHTLALNTHQKILHITESIGNIHIICEYYGKQNLLQDLYRTIYKIINGTPEYFSELGQAGFNEIFMDLFYWMSNHSFDHGLNGYIYSSTSGNINGNLNSPIHNRIGYLAMLLGFPHSNHMVNYKIFSICVDALAILINKALPFYGSIPLEINNLIPIMNKANLTEQFIDWSRQPKVLENQLAQYNQLVDQLRLNLLQWIDSTRYKIGYNIHDMTLDKMISATPISTGVRYAIDINKHWSNLPIALTSQSSSILQIYKMCEVAIKLGLGNYDFRFGLTHGSSFGDWNLMIPVTITIYMDFILNGIRYNINYELWHAPRLIKGFDGTLTEKSVLGWWQHCYQSERWTLQDFTKTNTYFENILKQACENKLNTIRQEMSSPSHTIGIHVETLCNKLQEKYTIILKLFELNDSVLEQLNSGCWIKTRLTQLINHENTYGHNIISFCDFVKEKALQVRQLQYNNPSIKDIITNSITKLNELSGEVHIIQDHYQQIKEFDKLGKIEYDKLVLQEQELIQKYNEEKKHKEIEKIKANYEYEIQNISQIGMQIGRSLTINSIIKKLESSGKFVESNLIKTQFDFEEKAGEITQIQIASEHEQSIRIFNSSFCTGSSMVLLEILLQLREYPNTLIDIQMAGHYILQQIQSSPTQSIECTMRKLLI